MEPIIVTKNLKHSYVDGQNTEFTALDGIDLTINQGEFVSIIGSNGSGKSTLAKHFNALLLPTSGTCVVAGYDTKEEENHWKIRQQVGMVFQNPDNQIVAAVVEEDVAFGLENIGVPSEEIEPRVRAALAAVGMSAYSKHAPHRLSGGQKQKIAIAGILALEPRCIVFDEPTAMLDPVGRHEIVKTVVNLNKTKHITVVYITHKMEEAILADRVIVMKEGKIALEGTPKEIFSQVATLKELGLEVPLAAEVVQQLAPCAPELPARIITHEELVEALCPLK